MTMYKATFLFFSFLVSITVYGQVILDSARLMLLDSSRIVVLGNVKSNVDILGDGTLVMNGSSRQFLDMSGKTISKIELDNNAGVELISSDLRIANKLTFKNGKLSVNDRCVFYSPFTVTEGADSLRYIVLDIKGRFVKELVLDVASFLIPIGDSLGFKPSLLNTSGSIYNNARFSIGVTGYPSELNPPTLVNFLKFYWTTEKIGIVGGNTFLTGRYRNTLDVEGSSGRIAGYFYNGSDWTSVGEQHDSILGQVGVPLTVNQGIVTGFNRFVSVGARAFLQGAYNQTTGLLSDNLRTLPLGSASSVDSFPRQDPYRFPPYSSNFLHVNNPSAESIADGILEPKNLVQDNIVDWVFLQLRDLNSSPGNNVLQTRSALLQRDGDIVDLDGKSPVTFNNVQDGNYILSVRHRNHLGLSFSQNTPRFVSEKSMSSFDTSRVFDMRLVASEGLFGSPNSYTTASHPSLNTVKLLWGGNANSNIRTQFSGLNNDRDHLLINVLGNSPSGVLSNVYHAADVNMNKVVRFSGLNNDRDFILIRILNNNPSLSRLQILPN